VRRETRDWWGQAREDLKTAEANLPNGRFYASVFFSQQAGEKALKALFIELKRRLPPKGHNMIRLCHELSAPSRVLEAAMELNPEYTVARYPNAAHGIPAEMYNASSAKIHLDAAKVIISWVGGSLK